MANNLLVDWLNKKPKATLRKASTGNVQTVVNNNTASNMQNITTPTINAGSVAGVQQVNKPTLQVSAPLTTTNVRSSIQSNNPAFNNGALVTAQNQPSRFIGFQQQPQVANTVLDRTPNEKQGLSWNRLVNGGYNYVPSEVSKAESSNKAEENRYRTMSEAFYDLQGTLYNKGKVLGENELRQKFPEFKDLDINILNELQNELLPIVSSGKGVDADQISQIYPELLKGKELKDINTVKENVQKGNDRYKGWEKAIQKVAKGDVEGMSSEGVQSVQDAKAIWQAVQAVKKDGVIGGGTDYEILRELYQRDPEIKRLMDDFNSRELTEKDKIIWGREDANKIGQLFRGATDWLRKDDEFMKSDEELESLKNKAKAMEDDYWGQVAGTARVGLRSTADTWEKFIYRMSQDAKLWTIEDIDDYLKQSEENERNVKEYNASVNRETENLAQNTINPDVRNYYNNHSMSRSIALGDVPGFFLQSTKSAAENIDMPIIIAAGVVAPEVVLPLMATDTYVRESEDAFETLLDNGAGYDDAEQGAVIVGVASTAVEIYLEKLLGGVETTASRTIRDALMKDISKKTTEMVAERGLVDLAKRGLTTQLRSSMEEGLEEIVQQSIQNYAVSKYNPDVKITDGLREAFEGGFFNPMNLLAGGGEIASNVDVNALNQGAYNAGVRTREIVDNTKNALNQGAYNAGAFLGNMTEDFKNSVSSQGGTNNTQQQGQQTQFNTTSENQNNINGENYNQNQKNSKTLNSVQLGLLKSNNRMNPTKITEFQEKFGKDYGQALADMGYTESQETNVPKIEQDTKEIYNEKKKAMNSVEGEFQDRSLRDMLNIMLKKARNTLDYDMIDKYEKLKQKHNTKGLTMAEANDMREEFSYKVKTRWGGDGNSDKIDLANNVYTAVKNFLEKTAEANGIKDLQKMNRDIAMRKYLSTRIGDKADRQSANNMVSLTDWVILAEAVSNPYAAAGFAAKKIVQKPKVKNAVLNAVVGRRENRTIDQQNRQAANKERMENIESANRGKELQQELTPSNIPALPNGIKLTKVTEIDARKPKNRVTKKNNNKKSDSSSSDDGGTPTGGTPTGTNPTNNQGGTPATDDTKNTVTKKKAETKKQVKNAITNQKSDLTADENVKLREGISILQEVKQEVDDSNFEGIVDIVNRLGEEKTKQVIKDMNDLRRKLENISERQAELGKDTRADRSVLHDLRGQILFLEYALNEKSNVGKTADGLDKVANHSRPSKVQRELIADEIEKYKYRDNDPLFNINVKTIRDEKLVRGALYGYMTDALAPTNRAAELGGNILRKVGIDPTEYEQEASKAPTHYTDGKANEYKTPEERATTPKQEENQPTKIVDKNGNPKTVYHYSDTDFKEFDLSKQKNKLGIYFSPSSKPNSKLRKYRINATINMQNPLAISPNNKASQIYPELQQYISDEQEAEYDTKFRELLIRDGYDGVIMEDEKGNVTQYVVLNPDQVNVKSQGPIKQNAENSTVVESESKTKATTNSKNKVTNPSKAKTTSLFNENEVDKGNKSEGLNPDALPLSDYKEMERLQIGRYGGLWDALQSEDIKDYMSSQIANEKVGIKPDWDDNEAWNKLPEDFEDVWEAVASDIEEMYDAYEEYLDMKNGGDTFDENTLKNTLESANFYANRQFPGKTAKEVIDQYTPQYEADLKIYNRLFEKYPGLANRKIDLTGAEGKARRELANQENETAQDIDYQELAERENETPQVEDEELNTSPLDLEFESERRTAEELDENETPQANEEEMNKVTKKQPEKPKNLVTNRIEESNNTDSKAEQIFNTSMEQLKGAKKVSLGALGKVKQTEVKLDNGTTITYIDSSVGKGISQNAIIRVNSPEAGYKTYVVTKIPNNPAEIREGGNVLTDEQVDKVYDILQGKTGEVKVEDMKVDVENVENKKDPINAFLDNNEAIKNDPKLKYKYLSRLNDQTSWIDYSTDIRYNGTVAEKVQQTIDSFGKLSNGTRLPIKFSKNNYGNYIEVGDWETGLASRDIGDDIEFEYAKFLYDNPEIRSTKEIKADGLKEAIKKGNEIHKEVVKDAEEQKAGTPLDPEKYIRQQPTADEGIEAVYNETKKISDYFEAHKEFENSGRIGYTEEYRNKIKAAQDALWRKLKFKSDRSKLYQDFVKNIRESNGNEKQLRSIAKNLYIQKVKDDFKNNYNYPTEVTDKVPGLRTAKDNYDRYLKGRDTSFSGKDPRIDYSDKDRIGAGIKRQDGNQITAEQRREIVNGVLEYAKYMGIDMKKMSEDAGVTYVHLNGKHPFLTSKAVGLFHGTFKSISVGADMESYREKMGQSKDAKTETHTVPVVMAHEITHAIDSMFEWSLFSDVKTREMGRKMNEGRSLGAYWHSKEEITARMVEEYVDVMKGGKGYYNMRGYWNKDVFDNEIKPYVEQIFNEKFDGYKLTAKERNDIKLDEAQINKNSVTASALNRVTSK